jgi:DNA-binding Xre family transcriptional regulator
MSQTDPLVKTLKRLLKQNGKTYVDVASCLSLSEASVKRLFSEKNISLQRLDTICSLMEIEISDLVRAMEVEHNTAISELTLEQEKEIANDLNLLMITVYILNGWKLHDIISRHDFTEPQCIRYLVHLDRIHIIELLPGNRIKLLVSPNFKWRNDGPIMQLFCAKIENEFFRTKFAKETEKLVVLNGMLSDASNALFQRKMQQLAKDFDTLSKDDAGLPIGQRKGYTLLQGIRGWNYERVFGDSNKSSNNGSY